MTTAVLTLAAALAILAIVVGEYVVPASMARAWVGLMRAVARVHPRGVRVAAERVPYLEGGRGAAVVLIHGFGGDKDNFTRIAPYLTPQLRVIAPDLAGFGESARTADADYRIAAQVERLRSFLQALGVRRAHFGGNSMGGFIAAEYATRYPDEVASLWLLDPAGTAAALDTAMVREYIRSGEIPLLVREPRDYGALLAAALHRPAFIPPSLRTVLARRAAADYALHTRIFRQVRFDSPLIEPMLPAIRAPTLIVWGQQDIVLSPSAAQVMCSAIPHCEVELMPEVGHLPMVERPRACARRYLRFLASHATETIL